MVAVKVSVSKLPLAASGVKWCLMKSSAFGVAGGAVEAFGGDGEELLGEVVDGLAVEVGRRFFGPGSSWR